MVPPLGRGPWPDDRVASRIENGLPIVVPSNAVALVVGLAEHFEDFAQPRRSADPVPVDDDNVAGVRPELLARPAHLTLLALGADIVSPASRDAIRTGPDLSFGLVLPLPGVGRELAATAPVDECEERDEPDET
jgi:hypothetical protein